MPLKERISSVDKLRSWKDEIPLHYEYTAGLAGERFLRGLQDGKILASFCSNCGRGYLPPKTYCVDCYLAISEFREVGPKARVSAVALGPGEMSGKKAKERRKFAFLTYKGVSGGIIHYVEGEVRLGASVTPRFKEKPERRGSLTDIEAFVPGVTR